MGKTTKEEMEVLQIRKIMEPVGFWRRIGYTIEAFPFKSLGLAILIAFLGGCILALGQL